jgi:hypothetical protein
MFNNKLKPMKTQVGVSLEADFTENTWTFEMPVPFSVCAGEFAIVPKSEYDELIARPSFNGELVLTLESKNDWFNKVPNKLPKKKYRDEQFFWIDANGNTMVMGEDLSAAERMSSFPIKVYRHIRVSDAERLET